MHDGSEVAAPDCDLVVALLREQFPQLADEAVRPGETGGSSNWVFRVGEGHAVRLPRSDAYSTDLLTEARFLPRIAPNLALPVPEIVLLAEPSALFPRPWTVVTWLPGENPRAGASSAQARLATALGRFVRRLHAVDTFGLPSGAQRWGYRSGEPVTDTIDEWVDSAADSVGDLFDAGRVREAWSRIRDVPPATDAPCWVHTDLSSENLLASPDGDLVGVIDFGGLGIGDRSVDLLYAWGMFDAPAREALWSASGADEATRLRARAWAFAGPGLVTIESYRHSMPARTAGLVRMVENVAREVGVALR